MTVAAGRIRSDETGSGQMSSLFGLVFFLGFATLAIQVVTTLFATSVATAAAADIANEAAAAPEATDGRGCGDEMIAAARVKAANVTGSEGSKRVELTCSAGSLVVTVHVAKPRLLRGLGRSEIVRSAVVRPEMLVDA